MILVYDVLQIRVMRRSFYLRTHCEQYPSTYAYTGSHFYFRYITESVRLGLHFHATRVLVLCMTYYEVDRTGSTGTKYSYDIQYCSMKYIERTSAVSTLFLR